MRVLFFCWQVFKIQFPPAGEVIYTIESFVDDTSVLQLLSIENPYTKILASKFIKVLFACPPHGTKNIKLTDQPLQFQALSFARMRQ